MHLIFFAVSTLLQASAQRELEESWQVYAELQRLVEQSQAELVELIATRQREAERHAQDLARGLENELSQLKRRSSELEAHAEIQDKVVFLQVIQTFRWHPYWKLLRNQHYEDYLICFLCWYINLQLENIFQIVKI